MSEFAFKKLSEIDTVSEPADNATIMGFENETPVQMPMNAIKNGIFLIDADDPEYSTTDTVYGDKIKNAILSGKAVWFYTFAKTTKTSDTDTKQYELVTSFTIKANTKGNYFLTLLSNQNISFAITV